MAMTNFANWFLRSEMKKAVNQPALVLTPVLGQMWRSSETVKLVWSLHRGLLHWFVMLFWFQALVNTDLSCFSGSQHWWTYPHHMQETKEA